jgi:hypothetical protein
LSSDRPKTENKLTSRLADKMRGISIDMNLVLDDTATSVKQSSYISPISVASADQPRPPMRPKATTPIEEAMSHAPSPKPTQAAATQPTSNRLNIQNAKSFASSRRSKIFAKVSSRISRLRDDKTSENATGQDDRVGTSGAHKTTVKQLKQSMTSTKIESSWKNREETEVYSATSPEITHAANENEKSPMFDSIQECTTEETALSSTLEGEVISDAQNADELEIYVDEYPHDKFLSLMDLLRANKVIQNLVIIRNRFDQGERTRRTADLDHLFHVLHILANSLVELSLQNIRLQDLTSISLGLYDHNSIEHLRITMETGTLDEETAKAMASLPKLLSLELEVHASFPLWPLLDSKSLTILSVVSNGFVFRSSDVLTMADKLETNSTLQVLDLEPRIPAWCLVTLITSLRSCSYSSLETLQFSCQTDDEKDGDACMVEMIKLLRRQQSKLRVVWNHCFESFMVSEEAKDRVLSALYVCNTLQQFHVFMESKEYGAVKCHVLERNMRAWKENAEDISADLYEL